MAVAMLARVLKSLAAVVVGYLSMVALITLVQEAWLGGVTWRGSSLPVLVAAGAGTFLAAVAGGAVAAAIAGARPRTHALVLCGLVVAETITLVVTGVLTDPLWFDVAASASLIVGLLLGAELVRRRRARRLQPLAI